MQDPATSRNERASGPPDALARFRHDARTPLHTLLGFAELLRTTPLPPDAARYADQIEQAARQLRDLVDALGRPDGPHTDRPG